ncbi:MAG: type II toxin-antitoxin system VapC family toxin, partial [Bacteroidetes bacterium]
MNGRILLDTSIVIPYFNRDVNIQEKLSTAENIYLPFIVIGELYYGAFKSTRAIENIKRIDKFVNDSVVLSYSTEVAREYGKLKTELKIQGHPIPEND